MLLSAATLERVRHMVTVGPGTQVAVKGVPEPVTVYELRGVAGEEAATSPASDGVLAEVILPAVAHVIFEKRVDETPHPVRVIRLGRSAVEFVAGAALTAAHPDLKLVLDLGPGVPAVESYVRVAAREPWADDGPGGTRIRAVFTSLAEVDRERIEQLVGRESSVDTPA